MVFFNESSCFLGLRPRLAIARHILRCALPLASRGGILGPSTLFYLLLCLRSRVERFDNCTQGLCELLDSGGVTPSFASFFREVRRHFSERQLVDIRRWLIASSTQFDGPSRFPFVPDHVIDHPADFRVVVQVSSSSQPVLNHCFGSHSKQCCLAHFARDVVLFRTFFEVLIRAPTCQAFSSCH